MPIPSPEGVEEAAESLYGIIYKTPIITSQKINEITGCEVYFKCEHLQKTGNFKARGAMNAVLKLMKEGSNGVITHSSGNHGQGLAWAARFCSIPCCVVVPTDASLSKVEAIKEYGARIEFCNPTTLEREATCASLASELLFDIVPPHDHIDIIHGQGTMAAEIVKQVPGADSIFLAVGGGGMASGVATYIGERFPNIRVFLVEPEGKNLNKVFNCLNFKVDPSPIDTVADGIRVRELGLLCEPQLKKFCKGNVITVQRVEPSAAVPLAGLLKASATSLGVKKAVVILCGGNVDIDFIP